jgi:hypothetical protein
MAGWQGAVVAACRTSRSVDVAVGMESKRGKDSFIRSHHAKGILRWSHVYRFVRHRLSTYPPAYPAYDTLPDTRHFEPIDDSLWKIRRLMAPWDSYTF